MVSWHILRLKILAAGSATLIGKFLRSLACLSLALVLFQEIMMYQNPFMEFYKNILEINPI